MSALTVISPFSVISPFYFVFSVFVICLQFLSLKMEKDQRTSSDFPPPNTFILVGIYGDSFHNLILTTALKHVSATNASILFCNFFISDIIPGYTRSSSLQIL